jgi:hypothetical protein
MIEVNFRNNSPNLSQIRKKAFSQISEKESYFNANNPRNRVLSNLSRKLHKK